MTAELAEHTQIQTVIEPGTNIISGAATGDFVGLANYNRVSFVIQKTAGDAGEDLTVTVQEATDAAGSGAVDLVEIDRILVKQGADITAIGAFTVVAQAKAATYTSATSGEADLIWVIDIMAADLSSGFTHVNISTNDPGVGTAQYVCGTAHLYDGRFANTVSPSAIT